MREIRRRLEQEGAAKQQRLSAATSEAEVRLRQALEVSQSVAAELEQLLSEMPADEDDATFAEAMEVQRPARDPASRQPHLVSRALPAETRMGPVHPTVGDLERSLEYYRRSIGLDVLQRENGRATLGAARPLLVLVEEDGAEPAPRAPVSSTSRSSCPSGALWRSGSRTPSASGSRSPACPITTSARRSTSAIRTSTGSRSTPTARGSSGRARSAVASRPVPSMPTICSASSTT